MTKKISITALIYILFQLNAGAGTMCQAITPNAHRDKYSFELLPFNGKNKCTMDDYKTNDDLKQIIYTEKNNLVCTIIL